MSTTYDIDYTGHDFVTYTVFHHDVIVKWECECGESGEVDETTELRMKGYMAHLDTIDPGGTK